MEAMMTRSWRDLHSTGRSSTRQPCGIRPKGQRPRRRRAGRAGAPCAAAAGQTLVEFALVLIVFMLVTVGLLDGMRVIFYYSQIQEAARHGARWGAVQVARAVPGDTTGTLGVGGTFYTPGDPAGPFPGNTPGTYCNVGCGANTIDATRAFTVLNVMTNTDTIVGATMLGTTAVDPNQVIIAISTTAAMSGTDVLTQWQTEPVSPTTGDIDPDWFTNKPVTVTVTYPFTPILSLGLGSVTLRGSSTVLHE